MKATVKELAKGAAAKEEPWDAEEHLEHLLSHPGFLIRRSFQIFAGLFDEELGDLGLTHAQWAALMAVAAFPGIDQTQVARAAGIDKTSSGRAIERLVSRGIVGVTQAPGDRRRKRLRLTREGEHIHNRAAKGSQAFRDRLLEKLTEAERETLLRALRNFVLINDEFSRAPIGMPSR